MALPSVSAWPGRFAAQDTYNSSASAFASSLATLTPAINLLYAQCEMDTYTAKSHADARGAVKWISGDSYTDGQIVWSPITFLNYRRKGAGGGTTDPSSDTANYQDLSVKPRISRSARTSNTILAGGDHGTLIDVTTASFTQTIEAAATLGSGWWCIIQNSSLTELPIDPNSTELIDGLATYKMYAGEARIVLCDGSAFSTQIIKPFFQRFTATATFTTPPGYKAIGGHLWGGGESGERTADYLAAARGGAGGGCTPFLLPASSIGSSQTLTIGAGGAAVTTDANGNPGDNTTFGSLATAYGGGRVAGYGGGGLAAVVANSPVAYEGGGTTAAPAKSIYGGSAASSTGANASAAAVYGGAAGGALSQNGGGCAVSLLGSTINTTSGAKTVTATPAVGDLIVLVVYHSNDDTWSAPTDNNSSGTYTMIGSLLYVDDGVTFNISGRVYVRDSLIASATSTVFTASNPGTDTGGGLAVVKVTGMLRSGSGAVRQYKGDFVPTGAATNPSTGTWTSAKSTVNPIIGVVINNANPAGMTPTAGYTELLDTGYSTPTSGLQIQKIDSGDTTDTMAWTAASSWWACIGIELDASAAGTPSAAGTSLLGGSGGASSAASNGTAGSVPGGGGGATQAGTSSGAGGAGAADIWGIA